MGTPALTPELVAQTCALVSQYIKGHRAYYYPAAAALTATQKAAMQGFFSESVLDSARVVVLAGERVQNPHFYPFLAGLGFKNLPDFSLMAAITFCDVVVSHEPFSAGLLFHELVHAEQYRQLGLPRFAELYVRGFLADGSYEGIPLEVNAYTLGARYEAKPTERFSVAKEVTTWIEEGRFE